MQIESRCISRDVNTNSNGWRSIVPRPRAFREPSTQENGPRETRSGGPLRALALPRRIYWPDEIQLSFQITIYNLAEKARHSCIREYARVGFCLVIPGPGSARRGARAEFGPACISPAGRSALIRHHSLAHGHVHASLSVQSSSEISVIPSNDFSPFVLRGPESGARRTPPVGPDGRPPKSVPFAPSSRRRLYPARNHYL